MIFLTKKQLEAIAQQIASISVKDSDFDLTDEINNDDSVAIVQDGINKRILIDTLREGIAKGEKGDPGESAYELAVDEGYVGTLDEWLNSLRGEDGEDGAQGPAGPGVPTGGSTGQVLAKSSNSDYATTWVNQSGGGAGALNDLSDVTISSPSQNQVLKYDGTKWVNGAGGGGGASSLNDLSDVTLSSPSNGQILAYDGTKWANAAMGTLNYEKLTSAQYAVKQQGGQLLSNILYIIVD